MSFHPTIIFFTLWKTKDLSFPYKESGLWFTMPSSKTDKKHYKCTITISSLLNMTDVRNSPTFKSVWFNDNFSLCGSYQISFAVAFFNHATLRLVTRQRISQWHWTWWNVFKDYISLTHRLLYGFKRHVQVSLDWFSFLSLLGHGSKKHHLLSLYEK